MKVSALAVVCIVALQIIGCRKHPDTLEIPRIKVTRRGPKWYGLNAKIPGFGSPYTIRSHCIRLDGIRASEEKWELATGETLSLTFSMEDDRLFLCIENGFPLQLDCSSFKSADLSSFNCVDGEKDIVIVHEGQHAVPLTGHASNR